MNGTPQHPWKITRTTILTTDAARIPQMKRQHRREAGVVLAAAKPPLLLTHCWCYQ
jgi:hypothetical protein